MLADAEKYAAADKEKRDNIDIKNQAETLCFEAEKELSLLKDSINEEKQTNISTLINKIRQESQNDQIESLKSSLEELKNAMQDMLAAKADSESNSQSNSNDL